MLFAAILHLGYVDFVIVTMRANLFDPDNAYLEIHGHYHPPRGRSALLRFGYLQLYSTNALPVWTHRWVLRVSSHIRQKRR